MKFVIAFCLSFQLAIAGEIENLKSVLDEYTYAMTVEWDQKDRTFQQKQRRLFQQKVLALVKNGLTKEEIKRAFAGTPSIDIEELDAELALIHPQDTRALGRLIQRKTLQTYKKGTSWSDGVARKLVPFFIISAIAALAIFMNIEDVVYFDDVEGEVIEHDEQITDLNSSDADSIIDE